MKSDDCVNHCIKCGDEIICTLEEINDKFICADCNGSAGPITVDSDKEKIWCFEHQERCKAPDNKCNFVKDGNFCKLYALSIYSDTKRTSLMQLRRTCGNCGGVHAYLVQKNNTEGKYRCNSCDHEWWIKKTQVKHSVRSTIKSKELRRSEK